MSAPHSEQSPPPAESPAVPKHRDPGQYVAAWKPFSGVMLLASAVLLGGGYLLAPWGGMSGVIAYILVCTTVGLVLTLAATAWGGMISLTESVLCGALFVMLPPYTIYYAATRWRWMSQPSVLFLCGFGLMLGAILIGRILLAEVAVR